MKAKLIRCVAVSALTFLATAAKAAITCSISSPGFTTSYTSSGPQVIAQSSYSITCTRAAGDPDPATTTYSVKVNNGLYANGVNNQAASGANRLKYDVFVNSTCATSWKGSTTVPTSAGSITVSGLAPTTVTQNFWGCIAAALTPAAGIYTDSITMTPTYSAGVAATAAQFPVTISTLATCTIASIPNIILAYGNAFAAVPVTATTNAPVTCSTGLTYTMAVSPTNGVSAGINYALTLPASGTGTGVAQNITITATAPYSANDSAPMSVS